MTLLSINNLHLNIQTSRGTRSILRGVNLDLYRGEIFGLIGRSGSGKSLMAHAIMQLLHPARREISGEIIFNGEALHHKNSQAMRSIRGSKIGMIFQDATQSLNPTMRIGVQIAESLRLHKGMNASGARARAIELLDLVGIGDPTQRYHAYPFELSGGMCQRVAIAMALAPEPELLIADEPTTALDATIQRQILNLFQTIHDKFSMTLMLITHDLGVVASICERVGVMHEGTIIETAPIEALFTAPQHEYTKKLLMQ